MKLSRRELLTGLVAFAAAPAIVRAESLMPVKIIDWYDTRCLIGYQIKTDSYILRVDRFSRLLRRPPMSNCVRVITNMEARQLLPKEAHFAFSMTPPENIQRHVDYGITMQQAREFGMKNGCLGNV